MLEGTQKDQNFIASKEHILEKLQLIIASATSRIRSVLDTSAYLDLTYISLQQKQEKRDQSSVPYPQRD